MAGRARVTVIKSGWLYRQSSILKRWKHNWFALFPNGDLKYFESKQDWEAEETIVVPIEIAYIKTGEQCEVDPPENKSRDALFALVTGEKTYFLCGEDEDDMRAWQFMLDQARTWRRARRSNSAPPRNTGAGRGRTNHAAPPPNPPEYQGGPRVQHVVYNLDGRRVPARVIYHPDGNTVVVYEDGRPHYCYGHGCYGCRCTAADAALGFGLGAATGALLLTPFMWGPFFW